MFKLQAISVKENSFKGRDGNIVHMFKVAFLLPDGDIGFLNTIEPVSKGSVCEIGVRVNRTDNKLILFIEGVAQPKTQSA